MLLISLPPLPSHSMDSSKPKVIGRCSIDDSQNIGQGSAGVVHEGNMKVAAKWVVGSGKLKNSEVYPYTLDLYHPNIIRIYDVKPDRNDLWLMMELCDCNLTQYLDEHAIGQSQQHSIMKQCADAVDYLHSENICHRDIKPQNILIKNNQLEIEGEIRLADFGLTKYLTDTSQMNTAVGTLAWKAPELFDQESGLPIQGTNASYRKEIDIFSLGLVFLYVLASKDFEKKIHANTCKICK